MTETTNWTAGAARSASAPHGGPGRRHAHSLWAGLLRRGRERVLTGTAEGNTLHGDGGNDVLARQGGADTSTVCAGTGSMATAGDDVRGEARRRPSLGRCRQERAAPGLTGRPAVDDPPSAGDTSRTREPCGCAGSVRHVRPCRTRVLRYPRGSDGAGTETVAPPGLDRAASRRLRRPGSMVRSGSVATTPPVPRCQCDAQVLGSCDGQQFQLLGSPGFRAAR